MSRIIMKCPKCGAEYELGLNFCKNCESILEAIELEETIPSTKTTSKEQRPRYEDIPDKEVVKKKEEVKGIREEIERSLVKAVIKELLIIKEEREKYNKLLLDLEEKKGQIQEELYNESKARYENSLMGIAKRFEELKATYTGLKEKVNGEVRFLEDELSILKGNLSELISMTRAGSISKTDVKVRLRGLRDEINKKEKDLKEKRLLQNLLSLKEKPGGWYYSVLSLNRKAIVIFAIGLLLVILFGYGLTKILHRKQDSITPEKVLSIKEEENITGVKELLEKIKKANLDKDIELFSSCYSQDYEGLDKRKEKALNLWKNFDFIHLEYILKDSIIKEREGTIRVSWDIKVRSRSGEIKDIRDDLTVFIIKDGDLWKIKRVIKEKV